MLQIKTFTFNPFNENTYVLFDESNDCAIIDPGCSNIMEQKQLVSFIKNNGLKPLQILCTHCHIDHVMGLDYIAETFDLPLTAHEQEQEILDNAERIGEMYQIPIQCKTRISNFVTESDVIKIGANTFSILHIPGHSPGSIGFYSKENNFIISGDVLFRDGLGRFDLPRSNFNDLKNSILNKLFQLPENTIVYSGHGGTTNIGYEKQHNPIYTL